MRYVYRRNALEGETTLELVAPGIQVTRKGGASAQVPYESIVAVRLRYAPTQAQANLYICTITSRAAFPIEVYSSSYEGFASFADHPTEYRAFVEELHRRLAAIGSRAQFVAGNSLASYIGNTLAIVLPAIALLWLIGVIRGLSLTWIIVIKLVAIAAMAPIAWLWFQRNRPRTYVPQAVPANVLPA